MEKLLAEAIVQTVQLHEREWTHDHGKRPMQFINMCATATTDRLGCPLLARPIYLLLVGTWNDALEWAEEVLI